MKIAKNTVVTLDYEIWNSNNHQLLDKMQGLPIYYLHGEYGDIFHKVETALEGKSVGDEIDIILTADEAFGRIKPELIQKESLSKLVEEIGPENAKIGMILEASSPEIEHILLYRITSISDDTVTLDANPPLAGQDLRFKAKVIEVKTASDEQIAFGSANLLHEYHDDCYYYDHKHNSNIGSTNLPHQGYDEYHGDDYDHENDEEEYDDQRENPSYH